MDACTIVSFIFTLLDATYLQTQVSSSISKTTWSGQLTHLRSAMSSEAIALFWATRKGIYSADFQDFVNKLDLVEVENINQMFSEFQSVKSEI